MSLYVLYPLLMTLDQVVVDSNIDNYYTFSNLSKQVKQMLFQYITIESSTSTKSFDNLQQKVQTIRIWSLLNEYSNFLISLNSIPSWSRLTFDSIISIVLGPQSIQYQSFEWQQSAPISFQRWRCAWTSLNSRILFIQSCKFCVDWTFQPFHETYYLLASKGSDF